MEPLSTATLRLPSIFSEHMVLRAGRSNPIWGWAAPGKTVTIRFQGESETATADQSGRWCLDLPSAPAGGPYTLEVSSGSETIAFSDVLAGEVWICSGQSNMEWMVSQANNGEQEVADACHPQIRLLNVPRVARAEVQSDMEAAWQLCSPKTAKDFSAIGYFFGRNIHQSQNVPVGLINSSWGGTVAEAWTEWSFLDGKSVFADFIEPYKAMLSGPKEEYLRRRQHYEDWLSVERYQDPGNRAYFCGWADLDADESAWRDFTAPGVWQEPDMHHRGAVWFRRQVNVPADWAGRDLMLSLGALHDFDVTYFNGEKVGGLGKETQDAWCTPRYYKVPASLIRPGQINLIAVRVFVEMDLGGFTGGGPLSLYLEGCPAESGIALDGSWKYRAEYAFDAMPPAAIPSAKSFPDYENSPSNLYNSMIAPLAPYGLSGAIWYQGESNEDRPEQYKTLFPTMIECWRKTFQNPEMPFLFVLLANYRALQTEPVEAGWGEIREAQLEALKLPHTAVASAIDIGDANNIHPKDKQTVGHRLALAARALVYGKDLEYSGPTFTTAKREGDRLRLVFDHTGSGLTTRDGKPVTGFAVRGSIDGDWLWAQSKIEGNAVVVWHRDLPEIKEVRYAWADNPIGNLSNIEGLPALPFRA